MELDALKRVVAKELGLSYTTEGNILPKNEIKYFVNEDVVVDIKGYEWYIKNRYFSSVESKKIGLIKEIDAVIFLNKYFLIIRMPTKEYKIDLFSHFKKLYESEDRKLLNYRFQSDGIDLLLLIENISIDMGKESISMDFSLFLKLDEREE
ncbi:MAG: hypothetical protein GXN91_00610, partial [Epsilonproteobacteria bacterium]|nr:hypothetical protein [Campylobacterota bacterium]